MNWQAAHLRLMSSLPVRTIPARVEKEEAPIPRPGRGGRAVIIGRTRYETIAEAARECGVNKHQIYKWEKEGKVKFSVLATGEEE